MVEPLALAAVVVRVAIRLFPLWRGQGGPADVSAGALEVAEFGLRNALHGHRAQSLLDPMEETVAKRVTGIMAVEFRSVPENEREAAILAVKASLEGSTLSDLIAADLNADRLYATISATNPRATIDLSEGATQLYRRVLADCCVVVVALADRAAGFEVGVFGALLDRLSGAQRSLDEMTALVKLLLSAIPQSQPDGRSDFEAAYRAAVGSHLDRLVMVGLPDGAQVYGLTDAYVALELDTEDIAERIRELNQGDDQASADSSHTFTVEEALAVTHRLMLRGEAGFGKSTVLQWIAVRCARGDFTSALSDWVGLVPFYIRLRSWTNGQLPQPTDFLQDAAQSIAGEMPAGWVNQVLRERRAVVLIDGVDELPEDMREQTREWLDGLIASYPFNRYIVSTRPTAAKEDWLESLGFAVARIEPLRPDAIRALITGWYDAYALLSAESRERERATDNRDLVLAAVNDNRHVRQLAASPLVAAVLCALQMSRGELPKSRPELYRIAIEVLMAQRPNRLAPAVIEAAEARALLQYLAYWMVNVGDLSVTKHDFRLKLASRLRQYPIIASADQVLNDLLIRSGLIREPQRGRIDFVHRTFQEFLAAEGALDAEESAVLVSHGHDDTWHQVIIMAVSQATQGQRERIIEGLLDRAVVEDSVRPVLNALAIASMETAGPINEDLRERVNDVAASLLPPRTPAEGETLAAVGPLALDLIDSHHIGDARTAAAVVRMATRVGGSEANRVMARCAKIRPISNPLLSELLNAWSQSPEPETFALDVMSFAGQRSLIIDDPRLVVGLQHLSLRTLRVQFARGYGSLSYVKGCKGLHDLQVFRDSMLGERSLVDLENHASLKALTLANTNVIDIAPLETVPSLESLQIRTPLVRDLSSMARLSKLTSVLLTGDTAGTRWEDMFAANATIRRLDLADHHELADLGSLAITQLEHLKSLTVRNAPGLAVLRGIEKWAGTMQTLSLQSLPVVDGSPIGDLVGLETLNLLATPVRDITMIHSLPALTSLHLGGLKPLPLPDLAPIAGHPRLASLHLRGVVPVDLTPLAGHSNLTVFVYGGRGRTVTGADLLGAGSKVKLRG